MRVSLIYSLAGVWTFTVEGTQITFSKLQNLIILGHLSLTDLSQNWARRIYSRCCTVRISPRSRPTLLGSEWGSKPQAHLFRNERDGKILPKLNLNKLINKQLSSIPEGKSAGTGYAFMKTGSQGVQKPPSRKSSYGRWRPSFNFWEL